MKKVLSILLVLMLVGAMMATTVMAATGDGNTVLIKARSSQGGEIAMNDEGGEPVFNPDYPMDNAGANVTVGDTVAFSAKADEGYKFLYWLIEDTGETYSTDETIYIAASEALSLLAAFDRDVERVLITAEALLGGQIAMSDDGSDPEFDPDYPMHNAGGNIPVGDTVIFTAKANDGYKFICWIEKDTEEVYSTEETIAVTAERPLTLVAAFDVDIEKVLLKVNTEGKGQIAIDDEGGEPEFDPE